MQMPRHYFKLGHDWYHVIYCHPALCCSVTNTVNMLNLLRKKIIVSPQHAVMVSSLWWISEAGSCGVLGCCIV